MCCIGVPFENIDWSMDSEEQQVNDCTFINICGVIHLEDIFRLGTIIWGCLNL